VKKPAQRHQLSGLFITECCATDQSHFQAAVLARRTSTFWAMQPDFDCHNEGFTVLPPVPHGTKFNKIKLLGFGTLIAVSDL
jgi:hypothetical protein